MEWLKNRWDLAGSITVVLCGVLRIFGPDRLAKWSGWTAVVFVVLIILGFFYGRSATLQALLGKMRRAAVVEPHVGNEHTLAFRGLLPFREEDASEFVKLGRQKDVAALLPAIRDPGLRVIVLRGESGCGKTSLIRAGLLPVLRGEGWRIIDVDPESQDLAQLIRSATAAKPNGRLLFVADQFEEHFLKAEQGAPNRLSDVLRETIERNEGKWLIGIRADFKYLVDDLIEQYGGLFQAEFLKPRVGYGLYLFTVEEAQSVISEVGKQVFEPGTGFQLARDLARGGRVLPADVQFVGFEMQQRRIRTLEEYRKAGARDGIIADSIRSVIEQFPGEDRKRDARKLLISLVDQQHGTRLPDALAAGDLAARAGVGGDVEAYCEPFVKQRLILRVTDATAKRTARYRLAHDYLVQPIYTAVGHTETDYEKVIRLLTLYAGEYSRNSQARIPSYDYRLIHRVAKKVTKDSELDETLKQAHPIIRATRQRTWTQRGIVTAVGLGLMLFLPPIRFEVESGITRRLNSGIQASQPQKEPRSVRPSGHEVVGDQALMFQYGRVPFVRRIPIPEFVMCCQAVANDPKQRIGVNSITSASIFGIGRFDVTVAQFNAFAMATDRSKKPGDDDLPVVAVSWDEAKSYCDWLSQITGRRFRLPTAHEWETACHAGGTDKLGANGLGEYAWDFENTTDAMRHLVGQKRSDNLGLYDMLGNVEQWVADWDEEWSMRSTRGGNWTLKAAELSCRTSESYDTRGPAADAVGFRVVVDVSH